MIEYAIKDKNTGEYFSSGGRGENFVGETYGFSSIIEHAILYGSKSPATAFVNQYNKRLEQTRTMSLFNRTPPRDLVVIRIELHYIELN